MKKPVTAILFALSFVICFPLTAQNKRIIDSLEKVLPTQPEDTVRFYTLQNLIVQYRLGNAAKAMELCLEQQRLAEHIGMPKFIGKALLNTAIQFRKTGDYESSVRLHLDALQQFDKIKDENNYGNASGSLGITYWQQGNLDLAITYMRKSLASTIIGS